MEGEPYDVAQLLQAVDALVAGMVALVFVIGTVVVGLAALSSGARQTVEGRD